MAYDRRNSYADVVERPGGLNSLRNEALRIAVEHGFTDATPAEDIALMHSELSEAADEVIDGRWLCEIWDEGDKPCGLPIEFADAVIRILHFCGKHGIDIESAVGAANPKDKKPFFQLTLERITAMHSDLSKALEGIRRGKALSGSEVQGFLANTIVRIQRFSKENEIDLDAAIREKMRYNESRPFKHGKVL